MLAERGDDGGDDERAYFSGRSYFLVRKVDASSVFGEDEGPIVS